MPDTTTLRGIEQGRADYAYKSAKEGKDTQSENPIDGILFHSKNYKALVKKVPMMVKTNGLGATFAFLLSKRAKDKEVNRQKIQPGQPGGNAKNAHDLVYQQTAEWIKSKYPFTGDFSDFIITQESTQYRAITNEIISFFTWLRRFAEGLIDGEDEQEG